MRRRSDRNPEFTRGDGVHIVPHNPAAEITYGITRYGWFIEPSEKGARVLLRSRDGKHWPVTVDFSKAYLEPSDVGPKPESLGGDPIRYVIQSGRSAYERRYLRETGSSKLYEEFEWVRDPREATHYKHLDGGAYVVTEQLRRRGSSNQDVVRYTVPDVDAEVRSLAEKYAALWREINAKPKPRPAKREKLAALAKATFAQITDLVRVTEAEAAVRHAGAEPNGRSRRR
jgi:hypothetical protein